jgi:glycosyltransferase involved in cell wall biosynthesis
MNTILIITDNLREQTNGVVTTFNNIERLATLDGYRVVYIDPGDFMYVSTPEYPDIKLSLPTGIGTKIKAVNPDYVHIVTEGPIGVAARIWLDFNGWKYNTSYHTKFPEVLNKIYHIPKFITNAYLRCFHSHRGRVLTTTQTMVDELKEIGFDDNILAWTRGVDRNIFSPETKTGDYILCVSRISKEKNLDAFCQLDYPHKVLVGDGPYLNELRQKYPGVKFVGKRVGKDLAAWYKNAKVFVFPSLSDTFGIVIIEAMACGTPVAAYPVTGPKDIIEQGVTGVMDEDLAVAIDRCLLLDRDVVFNNSKHWTWERCWEIFKSTLVKI